MFSLFILACATGSDGGADTANLSDTGLSAEVQAWLDETEAALEGYEDWDQLADWTGIQASESVHGDYAQIWLSADAIATIDAAAGEDMPVGALIAKQAYNDAEGTDERNLTVMHKVDADYGWFWASWTAEGDLADAGQPSSCTGCHASGQDSVMITTW